MMKMKKLLSCLLTFCIALTWISGTAVAFDRTEKSYSYETIITTSKVTIGVDNHNCRVIMPTGEIQPALCAVESGRLKAIAYFDDGDTITVFPNKHGTTSHGIYYYVSSSRGEGYVYEKYIVFKTDEELNQETTSATSGKCGQSATWSFDSGSGTLTIAGSGRMADYERDPLGAGYEALPPWEDFREHIRRVIVGANITYVGKEAFGGDSFRICTYPSLETITFESKSSVTKIGDYAFEKANAVESITLPASLEKIGYGSLPHESLKAVYVEGGNETFYSDNGVLYQGEKLLIYPACKEASSYAVLEGTKKITSSSFVNNFITSISIPGSVEEILGDMFFMGENLSQLTLAEGIKKIDCTNFYFNGVSLTRVDIPASVTEFTATSSWEYMGSDNPLAIYFHGSAAPAFDANFCDTRSAEGKVTVYYPQNATGWDAVQAQADVKYAVACGSLEFKTWEATPTEPDNTLHVQFKYPSVTTGGYATNTDCVYSDKWFFQDSYSYNHDLATMSLGLVMSGCDGSEKDSNVKNLLSDLGFNNDEYYYMEGYGSEDDNSVAFTVSKKDITSPKDNSTTSLLAICLRGSGYGDSGWAGNFEVGDSGAYHYGWEKAADAAYISIEQYCRKDHPDIDLSTTRVWLVGFSRSAAIANVLSQKLREGLFVGDNIYTYTFATPSATDISALPNKVETDNIFNTISASDLVPRVPLRKWYFWKTGVTKAFTGKLGTFNSLSSPCMVWLEETLSEAIPSRKLYHIGFQNIIVNSLKDEMTEDDVLRTLLIAWVPSALPAQIENFIRAMNARDYQEVADLCATWAKEVIKGDLNDSTPAVILLKSFGDIARGAVWEQGNPLCGTRDNTRAFNAIVDLIHDIANEDVGLEKSDLFQNHWPEAYMVLMRVMGSENLKDATSRKSKSLIIACPVDVEVCDENDNLIVKIVNNMIVEPQTDPDAVCTVMGEGEKVILLPEGHDYKVKILATDEGTMDYTVLENYADGTIARSVRFHNVSLSANQIFTCVVNDVQNTAKENYALTTGEDVIYPDYDSSNTYQPDHPSSSSSGSSSNSPSYSITIPDKMEHGTVTVSPRSAEKGDTVTITVKPDSGYVLETLTVADKNGKELTITDKGSGKYTFTMPASKVEVTVSYTEKLETITFADVASDSYYYEAVKWAIGKGITTGVGNDTFAPDRSCTRAQIVTFLWRAAGSPDAKSVSRFTDVSTDAYYAKAVAWAVENGVTTGTGDGQFSPDATCTRAQAVTFLYRTIGKTVDSTATFSDVPTDAYYANAVAWAAANGIATGIGSGLFAPNDTCTRAQIVTFLYRALAE